MLIADRLRCHGASGRALAILNNCLLVVVLRILEELSVRQHRGVTPRRMLDAVSATNANQEAT
jgi:hypothetical protein